MNISKLLYLQKQFYETGVTKQTPFRIEQLKKLKRILVSHEQDIFSALKKDLGKPAMEVLTSELGFVVQDINFMLRNVKKWNLPQKVQTPLLLQPGSSQIYYQPHGSVLIISPWNYPLQLALVPAIGAITAGNTVVLKTSEMAPAVSSLLAMIINNNFEPGLLRVMEGEAEMAEALLEENFNYVFFTGSSSIGKKIYQAAAKRLIPVTLELGGKNPCVFDSGIDLKSAMKRVLWGKFMNAGQTCIAPDYLLIPREMKTQIIEHFKVWIRGFYGESPDLSGDYGRIINMKHFDRLGSLLQEGEILAGGSTNSIKRYIEPTLIGNIDENSPLLQHEVFGPILPLVEYGSVSEVKALLQKQEPSLAMYIFSNDKTFIDDIGSQSRTGAMVINDTVSQIMNPYLPFGGVGNSGIGAYHGRATYDTFTRPLSVYKKKRLELNFRYPPFKDVEIARLKKWILK